MQGAGARRGAFQAACGTSRGTYRKSAFARIKPDGGFCFVPAIAILATWWAYKRGIIGLVDVRVWLAIFEVLARRCVVRGNRSFFRVEHEIAGLVGTSDEHINASLRRLERAGLMVRSKTTFDLQVQADLLTAEQRVDLSGTFERVENRRRRIPVPRRVLRFLCSAKRPVLIATVIGHLLRCMYYREGQCAPDGRCKASWVANVFEVDSRNVKAARRELVDATMLILEPTDQLSMNRWGPRVRFNLEWRPHVSNGPASPPPSGNSPPQSPPLRQNRKLSSRMINQEPAAAARTGACRRAVAAPTLSNVTLADLRDPPRLKALFVQAEARGWTDGSEAAKLRFFAAAERAIRVGHRNPAGLFVSILRRGLWSFIAAVDEDAARPKLSSLRMGCPANVARPGAPPDECRAPAPSRIVVQAVLRKLGVVAAPARLTDALLSNAAVTL